MTIFVFSIASLLLFHLVNRLKSDLLYNHRLVLRVITIVIAYVGFILLGMALWRTKDSILNTILALISSSLLFYVHAFVSGEDHSEGFIGTLSNILGLVNLIFLVTGCIALYNMMNVQFHAPWQQDLISLFSFLLLSIFIGLVGYGLSEGAGSKIWMIIGLVISVFILIGVIIRFFSMNYEHVSFYITGIVIILGLGYLFFSLKKKNRKIYGIIEILFSISSAYNSIGDLLKNDKAATIKIVIGRILNGELSGLKALQLFTAVYIFIRGLDNISEYNKVKKRSRAFYDFLSKDLSKAEILFHIGVDKSFRNSEGNSYSHMAVINRDLNLIEFLKEKKLLSNQKNSKKQTPIQLAQALGYMDIAAIIEKHDSK
ncbi:MAG: hypothetical protein INR73_03050 [Williamsia sp.]|nr:hypothetical protein [Williamsia sp.]